MLRADQSVSVSFSLPVHLAATVNELGCANSPGPQITLEMSGLNCRFIFRNNVQGTHTAEATATIKVLPGGSTVQIPKQPVLGGSGGNPFIFLQFMEEDDSLIGSPIFLGRCVQM